MVATTGSRAGDGHMGCSLQDSGAKRIPAVDKVLERPVAGKIVAWDTVFVRLIANLDAKQILTQGRDGESRLLLLPTLESR